MNPRYIKRLQEKGWKRFSEERVLKAMRPELAKKVDDALENISNTFTRVFGMSYEFHSNVDILQTPEVIMLHELMHTHPGGNAVDQPKDKCYLWQNILRIRNEKNADSLAYLGLVIQLITKFNVDVTKEGEVKGIDG
ncbi:hypothetical protein CkaCkLH20_05223 [Colletotrichum karsti]|uniref:Uncharacterized protein n=1 Tax=Colletotrichum karsti TaxID=1095194 RepID=A0A9P6I577_9PEZI|nr:uncharacterized protein CkaCkLH20_05223 [Colletotrichum karsti]KAF9877523.1 hypothetical protein CkaCkLH20_05223 [Colletotrichum karsti]